MVTKKMNICTLAEKSGISRTTLSRIKNTNYSSTWETACKIANALNLPVNEIIRDNEGGEVLHTGSMNINTEAELYQHLEEFPKFMKMLAANWDRLTKEDEDI